MPVFTGQQYTYLYFILSLSHILNKYGNNGKYDENSTILCIFSVNNFKEIDKNIKSRNKIPLKPKASYAFPCPDFYESHSFSSAFHDYIPHQILSESKLKRRKNGQKILWQRSKVRFQLRRILVKLIILEVN